MAASALSFAHPAVRRWFEKTFQAPTAAQNKGWRSIAQGQSSLLLAPTGSGKTLAAFLFALDRLMFSPPPAEKHVRVLYISPLKALGVDVERNLRAPIIGVGAEAERAGEPCREPVVGVRTGDTPQNERAKMLRNPPDILITTPESLYLLLTSQGRDMLRGVQTVIIDEIHSMVATKRGAHLFLSLERLEALRTEPQPLQRIGLSATQRPLEEIARLLGGGHVDRHDRWTPRPVEIVDAGRKRAFELTVEVPIEDMTRLSEQLGQDDPGTKSIWPSIHPRLVELIRAHRSTMIFVNSRRLAERLAAALNEEAQEEIALAHHGSLAKDKRKVIEELLKRGELPAIVATSSLELGIDMGAVDLVVQIEAPPSVASGIQRIGRAGHHVGATSIGVMFPKHRGDLLACAAASARMHQGQVEATHYPRNPLDVLAQHIVAHVALEPRAVQEVFDLVRGAAPFAELPRAAFEGVLDMLSGRYPSDEFAELRPRITWDRLAGTIEARHGARRIAVLNGGTIPDRGLYGVFLADGQGAGSRRVGELDEEMVFESRPGEVFLLGASSWRIEDITQDRVMVTPAPGVPGRMPFWHGDRPGRAAEFGAAIGALSRQLTKIDREEARQQLTEAHGLDARAAHNLLTYLDDQLEAVGAVPTDRTLVFERFIDEVGDWRVCILSPFGARVHAPWATAVMARLEDEEGVEADMMYGDDGMVFRLPEADRAPTPHLFFPSPDDIEDLVVRKLGSTSLFASHFRESAGRSLLLPKKHPQKRSPLWAQRRKSADLLKVASRFESFPIVLETYRECLKDVFDLPSLKDVLRGVQSRKIRIAEVQSKVPSPFASSLLFAYVGNFIYDGDAPLAERRAQILSIDHAQLKALLGEAELRALLDADAIFEVQLRLQRLGEDQGARHADAVHDLLLSLGDLDRDELQARCEPGAPVEDWVQALRSSRRIAEVGIAGSRRLIAAEDAGRYRDALGVVPPPGLPQAFLDPVADPLGDLVSRYARTHGPFLAEAAAARFGLGLGPLARTLQDLLRQDRVLEGEFLPGGQGREWCDSEVLKRIKRMSLARLRKEVEPVEPAALARFLPEWQGVLHPRGGLEALLSVVEQLQGCPLPASALEAEILPARVRGYTPSMLDELCAAGEVLWRGFEPIGPNDGRIALYLTDHFADLAPLPTPAEGERAEAVRALLQQGGAQFFSGLTRSLGGFPQDLADALWQLVWAGELSNDTLAPVRALLRGSAAAQRSPGRTGGFRSRRLGPAGTEGRWSLLPLPPPAHDTQRRAALAQQLLERYGVLVREATVAEGLPGGFSAVYPVLKAMEEAGKARRGYFVAGLGATQFAVPGADDRLRSLREVQPDDEQAFTPLLLAATDPANPYGAALPWPASSTGARPGRAAGAQVILLQGHLRGYLGRSEKTLLTFLPDVEPERSDVCRVLAEALAALSTKGSRKALLVSKIDGAPPDESPLSAFLQEAGFHSSSKGLLKRPGRVSGVG